MRRRIHFTGDRITNTTSLFNQGGFNLGLDHTFRNVELDFGGGMVSNIADSQGMQNNGLNTIAFLMVLACLRRLFLLSPG